MITEWSSSGFRVEIIMVSAQINLTCESQVRLARDPSPAYRQVWTMSQLIVPPGTPKPVAIKLVQHWIKFYDEDLLQIVIAEMIKFFDIGELVDPRDGTTPKQLDS